MSLLDIEIPTNALVALVLILIFLISTVIIYCLFGCDSSTDLTSTPHTAQKAIKD